ncbi:MAG: PEP-CTERM sorting domain-containing protein, partial [Rhodospirillaceae bacterium]
TADFADTAPGNLRADYVLPSADGLDIVGGAVFWPELNDPLFRLVGDFDPSLPGGFPTSDHRLVYLDIALVPEPAGAAAFVLGLAALALRRRRRD